MNIIIRSSGDP